MLRIILLSIMPVMMFFIAGCLHQTDSQMHKELVVYSELEPKFTESLVSEYNANNTQGITLSVVYELNSQNKKADLVLAERQTLNTLKHNNRLQAVICEAGDRIAPKFRDDDNLWYGAFYDPTVLLVNQQYARQIGQNALHSWKDLENLDDVRIAVENLSDNKSTQNFLGALASQMGESISLNYLWNIDRYVSQYAKFPFTPVRMTTVGDADIAITRQSYVFKYLENNFPAYVVYPDEGMPINLYGAGVFKDSAEGAAAADFINWLISSDGIKYVLQKNGSGFSLLLPQGLNGASAEAEKLWLNDAYKTAAQQDALTKKWLENVRFSN